MIQMTSFKAEPDDLIQEQMEAVERVLRSAHYILGCEVETFETAWATQCGALHAVGVGNGTDAIEIGLRILNIGAGDEVVTTAMSAFATTLAILRSGATPVFADITPETALLSPKSVERCLSKKTKALLLVHLYGQAHRVQTWQDFCEHAGIHLLEDCSHAHLASSGGKVVGTFGAWGAYSFYPTKNLGARGDAGTLVTQSTDLAEQAKQLRNYGLSTPYHHTHLGLNSRLDELQAALLLVRLKWLQRFTQRRREIAAAYDQQMTNPRIQKLAPPPEAENHVRHLYVILSEQRDQLRVFLREKGIETLIHYPIPIHQQPLCRQLPCDPEGIAQTEHHAKTCLSIPCHPQMEEADVSQVIASINAFVD